MLTRIDKSTARKAAIITAKAAAQDILLLHRSLEILEKASESHNMYVSEMCNN